MTAPMATAKEVLAALHGLDPDVELGFATEAGTIGGAYHITELKLAAIRSIDCGGRTHQWREASLQLLDGHGASWLPAGKAAAILERAVAALPEAETAPLSIEFGHGNDGLARYRAGAVETREGRAVVTLVPQTASCKPAVETECRPPQAETGRCCGTGSNEAGAA